MTPPGEWRWFPWGVLRGAGFSLACVEPLRSEALALAADTVLAAEESVRLAARTVSAASAAVADGRQRRRLDRAIRSQRHFDEADTPGGIAAGVPAWHEALEQRARASQAFLDAYRAERPGSTERLRRVFDDDRLRQAVLWQNRRAVPHLLRAKNSGHERALLKYVARYATKNDTIGFFGPVVWTRLSSAPGGLEFEAGADAVRATNVAFEAWPIALIAGHLASNAAVRPWLTPRRAALCRLQEDTASMPPGRAADLSSQALDILRLCDGTRTASAIVGQLGLPGLAPIEALHQAELITWTLDCPLRANPEAAIEELAARVADDEARAAIEPHRQWLASATGRLRDRMHDSASLAAALGEIDAEFEAQYGRDAVQSAGQYYAGRTLTHIDCERDASVTLHADLLDRLMTAASPLLVSLRWYTYTIATRFTEAVAAVVPAGTVRPLVEVFPHALGLAWTATHETADLYRDRWQRILPFDAQQRIVGLEPARLAAAVDAEFAAPHPGWPLARVHNPDVLVSAADPARFAAGEGLLVLGDLHPSLPSMFQSAIYQFCPEPGRVREAFAELVPAPPVVNEVSQRMNLGGFFAESAQLLLPDDPVTHVNTRPIADFDVRHNRGRIEVEDVTTGQAWTLPAFFDVMLSRTAFHLEPFERPHDPHTPRVVVGDVVVAREKWRVSGAALGIAQRRRADPTGPANEFLAVRRWARQQSVPRFVFAKSHAEPKPLFLDLDSQACVELLCHLLKRAAAREPEPIVVSEMLPAPDACWLHDRAGARYTSELRLLAVDPVPYPTAGRPVPQ